MTTNGSNMPFNTNSIIYGSKAMPVGRRGKWLSTQAENSSLIILIIIVKESVDYVLD